MPRYSDGASLGRSSISVGISLRLISGGGFVGVFVEIVSGFIAVRLFLVVFGICISGSLIAV